MHWAGRGAEFQCYDTTYVGIPFIGCTVEKLYARRLVSILESSTDQDDVAPGTHSVDYVGYLCP